MIKAVLMIQKRSVPAQANFKNLNPKIPRLEPDKMQIPTMTQRWNGTAVCVNNYGAAGSNAAIIVCRAPENQVPQEQGTKLATSLKKCPLFISADSEKSLHAYCTALRQFLTSGNGVYYGLDNHIDVLCELAHREHNTLSISFTACITSLAELQDTLSDDCESRRTRFLVNLPKRPTVLCFGGQTKAWIGLSEVFYKTVTLFRTYLDCCESTCRSLGVAGFYPKIFSKSSVEDIVLLQCMLFSIQYACAKSWIDCGLQVSHVIGHSFGQLTALCVSGSISLLQAMQFISDRANIMRDFWGPEKGTMLSVESDEESVCKVLSLVNQANEYHVEIACFNSPSNYVLAGSEVSIEALESELIKHTSSTAEVKVRRLNVTHGFHSRFVDPILPKLGELANSINFHEPRIQIETCSKGRSWTRIDAKAVARLSREPVYFSEAVNRIAKEKGPCNWIEAGTDSGITIMVRRALDAAVRAEHTFHPICLTSASSMDLLAEATVKIWQSGLKVQFWPYHRLQRQDYQRVFLPPYQFEKHRHWLDYSESWRTVPTKDQAPSPTRKLLSFVSFIRPQNSTQSIVEYMIDPESQDFKIYVQGHKVLGNSSCPASVYIHLAAQALAGLSEIEDISGTDGTFCIEDFEMPSPLGPSAQKMIGLSLESWDQTPETWFFRISSRDSTDTLRVANHASGKAYVEAAKTSTTTTETAATHPQRTQDRLETNIEGSFIYGVFSTVVEYAQYFRCMRKVSAIGNQITGFISPDEIPTVLPHAGSGLLCDPLMIDNVLQVAGVYINCLRERKSQTVYVCTYIQKFRLCFEKQKQHFEPLNVFCRVVSTNEKQVICDITASNARHQKVVVQVFGARFTGVPVATLTKSLSKLGSTKVSSLTSSLPVCVDSGGNAVPQVYSTAKEHSIELAPSERQGVVSKSLAKGVLKYTSSPTKGSRNSEEGRRCFTQLQQLLNEVTDVPVKDMHHYSLLEDVGVDSLMTIEVLSEIQKAFHVSITVSEFEEARDLDSLCSLVESKNPQELRHVTASLKPVVASHIIEDLQESDPPNLADNRRAQGAITGDNQVSDSEDAVNFGGKPSRPSDTGFEYSHVLESFLATREDFPCIVNDTYLNGFSKSANPCQVKLVIAYVVEAFQSLGCTLLQLEDGDPVSVPCVPQHTALVKQLYRVLENASLIHARESGSVRSELLIKVSSSHEILQRLLHDFPQHSTEHRLLGVMGPQLANFLCGKEDPVHHLFGDTASKDLLTDTYTKSPIFATGTRLLASFLSKILATKSQSQLVRVLEVGGGVGGTTASIIELLESSGHPFTYTFTDISPSLVAAAKKRFTGHDSMGFEVLDVEAEPQDFLLRSKDVIIATNVIHATKSLTESCSHLRQILDNNGMLCLVELTRNLSWFDLVFGPLDGWWRFEDGRKHAIADVNTWMQSLNAAGFEHVVWTGDGYEEGDLIRLIAASHSNKGTVPESSQSGEAPATMETMLFKYVDRIPLYADIYYPNEIQKTKSKRPIGTFSSPK